MSKNFKTQKGITLISLIITLIIMMILTFTMTINGKKYVQIKMYTQLGTDISELKEQIDYYYSKNKELPICNKYVSDVINLFDKSPNDGENYYVIDLSKLEGIRLNYGKDFYSIQDKTVDISDLTDLYIVNEESHIIYYPKGMEFGEKIRYTTLNINDEKLDSLAVITYDANGGEGTMNSSTYRVAANEFTAPEGKVFIEWNTSNDGTGTKYNPGDTVDIATTLYAQWDDIKLTYELEDFNNMIYWDKNNASVFNITYDSTTKLNEIIMTGISGSWEMIIMPITTTIGNTYTIQLDYQNTQGYTGYSSYPGIGAQILSSVPINGSNESNQIEVKYLPKEANPNLQKISIEFTATNTTTYLVFQFGFVEDGGTGCDVKIGNIKINEIKEVNKPLGNLISLQLGDFGDFYTSKEGETGTKITPTTIMPNDNLTCYAQNKKVTVTFDPNGGTTPSFTSKEIDLKNIYGELPTTSRSGYKFLGWFYHREVVPPEYQEVEYIKATGTQYIDTDYDLWKDKNWKMEFKFEIYENYNYNNMFGSLGVSNTSNEIWISGNGEYRVRLPSSNFTLFTVAVNTTYTIIHDNTESELVNYVNGALTTKTRANTEFTPRLGFGHRESSKYLKGKMYYLKFWSNGELVRNFIPCYAKTTVTNMKGETCPSGTIGMYDLVEGKFYTNAGTGTFDKGDDINSVTESTQVTTKEDHTLYAIWEEE